MACDFTALVQNGFCTSPVAHQGHDLALARPPLQGSFERRSCTSTAVSRLSYPSTKQLLYSLQSPNASRCPTRPAEVEDEVSERFPDLLKPPE